MEFHINKSLKQPHHDCLVIGFCNDKQLRETLITNDDEALSTQILQLSKKLTDKGEWVWHTDTTHHVNICLYHCGPISQLTPDLLHQQLSEITKLLIKQKIKSVHLAMPQIKTQSADAQLKQMVLCIDAACYQFNDFKTTNLKSISLQKVYCYAPEASKQALHAATATAEGIQLTRWLADLPANRCTPTFLADQAKKLEELGANITVMSFGPETMHELGMGALLAVSQGSHEPPRFIEVTYQGTTINKKPVVLVGKGVTFDSGGISLKAPPMMEEMKYDMAGAASVLGAIKACALMKLPINIVGLIPSTENLPSGTAVKPGDIVKSLSGQTIEIVNTDAEGRLILADALTYASRFNPSVVLDMATLTGAVIIALGHITSGFMTQDDKLAELISHAAKITNDKAWRLPLDEAYQEGLESPVADMLNATADRSAGSIVGGSFLARFTKEYRWAHIDIAGTAWISGKNRQATGRPVPLLVELLHSLINHHE